MRRSSKSWDTAIETGDANNPSVCTTWGSDDDRLFLLNVDREHLGCPDLREHVLFLQRQHSAQLVIMENASSGTSFRNLLSRHAVVQGLKPASDKVSRLAQQTAKIEAGMVFLPKDAPWLEDFEKEIMAIQKGKLDDLVNSLTQFLRGLGRRPYGFRDLPLYKSKKWMWEQVNRDAGQSKLADNAVRDLSKSTRVANIPQKSG